MRFMQRLQQRYRHLAVGYSGHEAPDNLDVVKAAVALGARMLERHVGLPHDGGALNAYSLDAAQTAAWVESALRMREICGAGRTRSITPEEIRSLHQLTRGTFARRAVARRRHADRARTSSSPCPAVKARRPAASSWTAWPPPGTTRRTSR